MKTKILICVGALIGVAAVQQVGWPVAKLTVRVVDEQKQPIEGASVKIGFRSKLSDEDAFAVGETNKDGDFTAEGHSDKRLLADARKTGFYDSGSPGTVFGDPVAGKWQPWNPVAEIILRPIGTPVALYAKSVQADLPVLDKACGYDLEKGDWVRPYGKGGKADFIFTGHREFKARNDFDVRVELTFPNPHDGILETKLPAIGKNSRFRAERKAPMDGYNKNVEIRNAVQNGTFIDTFEQTTPFFFRVRTVEEGGRIIAANYGKILGGLRLDGVNSQTCTILFTYYLNPTSLDQNTEWDTTKNLIPGLKPKETPREP
jgi:hypothetical protein